jgi:hypothetical protein
MPIGIELRQRAVSMSKQNTRTYAQHWGAYYDGPEHSPPPPRRPWLRDSIIATVGGLLLGRGLGIWIADGYWPLAGGIGALVLFFDGFAVGLGQLFEGTRLKRSDLLRIAAFGLSATVVVAAATSLFQG